MMIGFCRKAYQSITGQIRKILPAFLLLFFSLSVVGSAAAAEGISSLRIGQGIGNVRLVLDSDCAFDYKVFLLNSPKRLVIDTRNVRVSGAIENFVDKNNLISGTRLGNVGDGSTRIVFDLQKPAVIKKAFMLPPQSSFGYRFVVDIEIASEREFAAKVGNDHAFTTDSYQTKVAAKKTAAKPQAKNERKNTRKVIVLDPGHGGKDPGAIGYSGVYEKHLTLAMAKELKAELEKGGNYKVYLTRSTDIFIPLRERVKIARRHKADLFLSIHADSIRNRSTKGLSVYTLSETASDKEAAALAERENKADVIAGLDFSDHTKEVADILINLAQRETMNRSSEFATFMVQEMKKSVKLVDNTHRFAGFAVLKAPDVPSVLLEMGYLSNSSEERLLKQKSYRKKLATSAGRAIDNFFDNMQHASLF